MSERPEIDEHSGVETTGHEWDGIKELNNPLPRWWLIVFYACIAWAVVYWVLMPAWPALPGMQGYTHGLRGQSDRNNVAKDLAALDAQRAAFGARLAGASLAQIESDPQLLNFALEAGRSAFANNCSTCHGAGAQGGFGYPNLNDDDWLWGGRLEDIRHTLEVGVRSTAKDTRMTEMPAFGADGLLKPAEIDDLVEYVVHLSGRPADAAAVASAAPIFQQSCSTCHGPEGKGDRTKGAPNLTDAIWLYGGDRKTIRDTIWKSRHGVMPTWGGRLDPMTLDALAVYVHSLGGGE
jgi:cytochrome c oxidase cbb3-type subunit III